MTLLQDRRVQILIVVLGVGAVLLPNLLAGGEDPPATFEVTLPEMVEEFGADTPVLAVTASTARGTSYEIVTGGEVLSRAYQTVTSSGRISTGNGTHSTTSKNREESESSRPSTAQDERLATVTLGDLDPGVVEELRGATNGNFTTKLTFDGRRWLIAPPGLTQFVAKPDGTGVRKLKD